MVVSTKSIIILILKTKENKMKDIKDKKSYIVVNDRILGVMFKVLLQSAVVLFVINAVFKG